MQQFFLSFEEKVKLLKRILSENLKYLPGIQNDFAAVTTGGKKIENKV
jgi:hypothetical protein